MKNMTYEKDNCCSFDMVNPEAEHMPLETKTEKKMLNHKMNVMNATLSQNVVVISYNEVPPTNITERVQLKFTFEEGQSGWPLKDA